MRKTKIILIVLTLSSFCFASDPNTIPFSGFRTPEEVIVDICKYIDPNSLVLDAGCAEGRVLWYFSKRGHRVIGIERNHVLAKRARSHKFNVITGDILTYGFPKADITYIWVGNKDLGPIVEKIEQENIKRRFIIGNYNLYIYNEFFKSRGMEYHVVKIWDEDFTYWIWDR